MRGSHHAEQSFDVATAASAPDVREQNGSTSWFDIHPWLPESLRDGESGGGCPTESAALVEAEQGSPRCLNGAGRLAREGQGASCDSAGPSMVVASLHRGPNALWRWGAPASSAPRRLNARHCVTPCSRNSSITSGMSVFWNGSVRPSPRPQSLKGLIFCRASPRLRETRSVRAVASVCVVRWLAGTALPCELQELTRPTMSSVLAPLQLWGEVCM